MSKSPVNKSDAAVPHSAAMSRLDREEKEALEHQDEAERESGPRRTQLQEKARQKTE